MFRFVSWCLFFRAVFGRKVEGEKSADYFADSSLRPLGGVVFDEWFREQEPRR